MKQYRSTHSGRFKGYSRQELEMTSWKRSSNSNFAPIPQQSSKSVTRPANKHALADAIWSLIPSNAVRPTGQRQYKFDGGFLVHRNRGSGVQPTMTYVGSTQTTSPENTDMPLLCSTGTKKDHPRKMVLNNAAHVEEQAH